MDLRIWGLIASLLALGFVGYLSSIILYVYVNGS